jgi:hypothetical protein
MVAARWYGTVAENALRFLIFDLRFCRFGHFVRKATPAATTVVRPWQAATRETRNPREQHRARNGVRLSPAAACQATRQAWEVQTRVNIFDSLRLGQPRSVPSANLSTRNWYARPVTLRNSALVQCDSAYKADGSL